MLSFLRPTFWSRFLIFLEECRWQRRRQPGELGRRQTRQLPPHWQCAALPISQCTTLAVCHTITVCHTAYRYHSVPHCLYHSSTLCIHMYCILSVHCIVMQCTCAHFNLQKIKRCTVCVLHTAHCKCLTSSTAVLELQRWAAILLRWFPAPATQILFRGGRTLQRYILVRRGWGRGSI